MLWLMSDFLWHGSAGTALRCGPAVLGSFVLVHLVLDLLGDVAVEALLVGLDAPLARVGLRHRLDDTGSACSTVLSARPCPAISQGMGALRTSFGVAVVVELLLIDPQPLRGGRGCRLGRSDWLIHWRSKSYLGLMALVLGPRGDFDPGEGLG